jgi:hypothetical protein
MVMGRRHTLNREGERDHGDDDPPVPTSQIRTEVAQDAAPPMRKANVVPRGSERLQTAIARVMFGLLVEHTGLIGESAPCLDVARRLR